MLATATESDKLYNNKLIMMIRPSVSVYADCREKTHSALTFSLLIKLSFRQILPKKTVGGEMEMELGVLCRIVALIALPEPDAAVAAQWEGRGKGTS